MLCRRRALKIIAYGGIVRACPGFAALSQRKSPTFLEMARVADFEGGGDDDTARIKTAFHWLGSAPNRRLSFETRRYVVSSRVGLFGAHSFGIAGNGATIAARDGMPVENEYQILYFRECTDGEINDLIVDANRSRRLPAEVPAHSVDIHTGCMRLTLNRVQSNNAVVDGFYINSLKPTQRSSVPSDIEFRNCSARNAFRNNVSVINSIRFRDYDGVYTHANGTPPMAGMDFEPNGPDEVGNNDARCYRTRCDENKGAGFQFIGANTSATLRDVISAGNGFGAVVGNWGYLRIDGAVVENYGSSIRRGVIDAYDMSGETHINRVIARNCNPGTSSKPIIFVHPRSIGPVIISNVTVINSTRVVVSGNASVKVSGVHIDANDAR